MVDSRDDACLQLQWHSSRVEGHQMSNRLAFSSSSLQISAIPLVACGVAIFSFDSLRDMKAGPWTTFESGQMK
jgi:hypothetical protein